MTQVNVHICKHENPIQTVICNYTETSTMKAQNVNSFLRIDERERVSLNYHHSAITNMRTTKQLASKSLVLIRDVLLMTIQVNSSFLRTEKLLSMLKYLHATISMMKTQMSISKPLVVLRDVLLMTIQVNSSFLRTENKKQIAPFLRSEGVL